MLKVSSILVSRVLELVLIPYSAVSLQVTACIVMNPVVGCHQLPPDSQRHTCIVMNPVVGCHHLPPPPTRLTATHTCIFINPALGFHYFPPGLQLPSQPSGITTQYQLILFGDRGTQKLAQSFKFLDRYRGFASLLSKL